MLPVLSHGAAMNDYCVVPPFIAQNVPSNLLLMLDNSSSMYDLSYSDQGNTSVAGAITRQPYYCYDETYRSNVCSGDGSIRCSADADCASGQTCTNVYAGYFDSKTFYTFDFNNKYFTTTGAFPAAGACNKYVSNNLCVGIDNTNKVNYFVASGNYLNWLTASKLDAEKKILTGGKYVSKLCVDAGKATDKACDTDGDCASGQSCTAVATSFLQGESRGCVGQPYIKTALTASFTNFNAGTEDPNTKLGITFSIRGPVDSANPSSPSRGGQTYIDIYGGSYNNVPCQQAVDAWATADKQGMSTNTQACINYNSKATNYCSGDPSRLIFATCTVDADCEKPVAAKAGGCSNDASTSCTADADCGTSVTQGHCSNNAAQSCSANGDCGTTTVFGSCDNQVKACLTNAECTIGGSMGSCSNQSKACTQNSDCTIATVNGSCSNQSKACTQNSDCTKPAVNGTCSNSSSRSGLACTANTDCPTLEVLGRCNVSTGTTCRSDADCGSSSLYYCSNNTNKGCSILGAACSGSNGTCVAQTCLGYVAASYATCNNYVPPNYGTCTGYSAGSTGNCTGYVAGSAGSCNGASVTQNTCVGASTVQNTCSNPAPTPATTLHYGPCVNPDQSAVVKTKVAYTETINTCSQFLSGGSLGSGDITNLTTGGKCTDVYAGWGICSNDNTRACSIDNDCGGNACIHGPASLLPGNPGLVCSLEYLGAYYTGSAPAWSKSDWSNDTAGMIDAYKRYCRASQPTVIDPTDTAASSTNYEQFPAILGGMGVEGQLGSPIGSIPVRLVPGSSPSGLVQEFGDRIRIGAMHFNFNGSKSEAASGGSIALPQVCSNDTTRLCIMDKDCFSPGTCMSTAGSASYNLDGAIVERGSHIGKGKCATMTVTACSAANPCTSGTCINGFCGTKHDTECATDTNCSAGDTCISDGVGDHSTGLVNIIDKVRANAWTPLAEGFYEAIGYFARTASGASRTDLRLNADDYDATLNPSQYRCQQNYVLLITDGSSTADRNASVQTLANTYKANANPYATTPTNWSSACSNSSSFAGSTYLPVMTWIAKNLNIADFTKTPQYGRDIISTYIVATGGSNGLPATDECNSIKMLTDAAANGGTTLRQANNAKALEKELRSVFETLSAKSASGTAASILSNSEGSGANILQAIFYPRKIYDEQTEADWIGEINNIWYYVDPFINNSTMREDSNTNFSLELSSDNRVEFYFDQTTLDTKVNLKSPSGGAVQGGTGISPDNIKTLWKGGRLLWSRDLTVSPRTIYTPCDVTNASDTNPGGGSCVSGTGLMTFTYSGASDNSTALMGKMQYADNTSAAKLMKYVHGYDYPGDAAWRSRTVKIGNLPASSVSDISTDLYVTNPRDKGIGVWKLGDIISSTPRLESTVKLNAYDDVYGDGSYKNFVNTNAYKSRGVVFAGANDGMLHAFNLGVLNEYSGDRKASLSGSNLGNELWAYIPYNALPYLKYYAEPSYSHLYFVDGTTTIADASVGKPAGCTSTDYWDCSKKDAGGHFLADGSNWRTILVGGMGIGGASRNSDDACAEDVGGTCVKTPISGIGYSAYYALDVTDPLNPRFLWEFSDGVLPAADKGLGFATSGASIVRVSARNADGTANRDKNGRWFAIFGSGPTGPIDKSANHRFMGTSSQPLKVYIVDLNATLPFTKGVNYWVIDTVYDGGNSADATVLSAANGALANAFAGSLSNGTTDFDRWNSSSPGYYQDDAVYFGYVQKSGAGSWTDGGVLKLVTSEDPNPAHWKVIKVIDGTGPVTTRIARLQDRKSHKYWLYFGTGRYSYLKDDFDTARKLYGVKEPCYLDGFSVSPDTLDSACAVKHSAAGATSKDDATVNDKAVGDVGWRISLYGKDTSDPYGILGAERVITNPVALANGAIIFTTYMPNNDFCQAGGKSFMWGVTYDSGTQLPSAILQAKALIQLSTGEFKQLDLQSALNDRNGRRMSNNTGMTGKPSTDAPPLVSKANNRPVRQILHMQER